MKNIKKKIAWLMVSLVVIVFSAMAAHGVETEFGKVSVERVYFDNEQGYQMSGFLYKPDSATNETPAPAIVVAHGNNGYTGALTSYNIELSRRGYVVLALEMEGHGQSDYVPDAEGDGSYGGVAAARYLRTLDFVDENQLGGTGHSKGSNAAVGMAKAYPENVKAILLNGYMSPSVTGGALDEAVTHTNVGLNMSRYDECGQDLLHHILGTEWNYDYLRNKEVAANLFSDKWGGADTIDYMNEGLGDWEDGSMRIFYSIEDCTHVTTVNSKSAIENGLDFFMNSIDAPNPIDSSNQVWSLKFVFGTIEIIGIVMLLITLANLLMSVQYFSLLREETSVENRLNVAHSIWYKVFFITLFTIIPVVTFVPCYVYGENNATQTALFPFNPASVGYLIWTIANAVLMLVVFIVWHFAYGKKHGGNMNTYGFLYGKTIKDTFRYIGKSFLFAVCVIVPSFIVLKVVETTTATEAATWIFCLRTFRLDRIIYFIEYFIPFFVCFVIGSLAFSTILREDDVEVKKGNMLRNQMIGILQSVGGLTIMYVIWNIVYFVSGRPSFLYRETPYVMGNSGFMCICFSLIPMFGINGILSTHMSVKSKRIWVGAFVCALFIVWVTFAGQSLALPSTQSAVGALAK